MSGQTPTSNHSRMLELLADRALCGLSEAEQRELEALCSEHLATPTCPLEFCDLDAAAAEVAVELCCAEDDRPPPGVVSKLQRTADEWCAGHCPVAGRIEPARAGAGVPSRAGPLAYLGWIAAAACLGFAVWLSIPRSSPGIGERLAAFEASAPDIKSASWGPFNDLATGAAPEQPGVNGTVEWSESRQTGFLRFKGLKANDPRVEQYQLWIIDKRGLNQRISGAVFDAAPDATGGEVIVPIEPRLAVNGAAIFAVTVEAPGGVWVSDMTRRVVLAKLSG